MLTSGPLVRDLSGVPAYVPGRAARSLPVTAGRMFSLSSNENPAPPPVSVTEAIARALAEPQRYPDMFCRELVAALASHHDVDHDRVVVGTGSVGVLGQVLHATCEPGDEVVMAWRSFEAYPIATAVTGARPVRVPLTGDARHDLPAMAAAVTPATRVVLLCSPNNPTGPALREHEVRDLLDELDGRAVVVLDEAYVDYVTDADAADGPALLRDRDELVVLRTFSKAYSLAALRVGYALAAPRIAAAVRATSVPFGVSAPAQAGAVAALGAHEEIRAGLQATIHLRDQLVTRLRADGWQVPDAQGNFVWLPLGGDSAAFAAACEARRVTVRPFPGEGVRVSVGEADACQVVLDVATDRRWAAARG